MFEKRLTKNEIPLRFRNKYRALWEFSKGIPEVDSTPPNLQIARSNLCNFHCVYCIDHRIGNKLPRTKNEGATWEQLLRLIPKSESLAFHGVSEFMIDPEFFEIVALCAQSGSSLSLNTNGSVCTPRHLEVLANYPGYVCINFSLDAATPETYLRIRGQDFWQIVHNIQCYVKNFESRRDSTQISISFVIAKSTVRDMLPFTFLAKALNVQRVKYYRLHEDEALDWSIPSKAGGMFDYRKECVRHFGQEYNQELERTRKSAELLGLMIELPAPLSAEDIAEMRP